MIKKRVLTDEHKKKIGLVNLGKIRSESAKNKMSNKAKNRILTEAQKQRLRTLALGRKHTEETKRKMSEARVGNKTWSWKGGITKESHRLRNSKEYKIWREAVVKRDGYKCIWCASTEPFLHADHIKPFAYYPELRFAIDNGRTLCAPCHRKTYKSSYGKNHE